MTGSKKIKTLIKEGMGLCGNVILILINLAVPETAQRQV